MKSMPVIYSYGCSESGSVFFFSGLDTGHDDLILVRFSNLVPMCRMGTRKKWSKWNKKRG